MRQRWRDLKERADEAVVGLIWGVALSVLVIMLFFMVLVRLGEVPRSRKETVDMRPGKQAAEDRKKRAVARREAVLVSGDPPPTPAQRLARLDAMLGPGIGAKKERAKLAAKMAPVKAPPKARLELKREPRPEPKPDDVFVARIDGREYQIKSVSQVKRLADDLGFDVKTVLEPYRKWLAGARP